MPRSADTTYNGSDPMGTIGKALKSALTPVKTPVYAADNEEDLKRADCMAKGGQWINGQCILPGQKPAEQTQAPQETGGSKVDQKVSRSGDTIVITDAAGNKSVLSSADYEKAKNLKGLQGISGGGMVSAGGEIGNYLNMQNRQQVAQAQLMAQNQALAGQVGQFEQLGVSPTGTDYREAGTAGLVKAIPQALSLGAAGLTAGLIGGTAVSPGVGTAVGAVAGFTTGISSGIIANMKKQRTDSIASQMKVLKDGKQNLANWATLAASDPANRIMYISQYNDQMALIDQAYRQLKLDTTRDVAKFEDAQVELQAFEDFFAESGARNYLNQQMILALQKPQDPEYIYRMQLLSQQYNEPQSETDSNI